jgi:hypothetical protein
MIVAVNTKNANYVPEVSAICYLDHSPVNLVSTAQRPPARHLTWTFEASVADGAQPPVDLP